MKETLPKTRPDGWPRRSDLELQTETELAIGKVAEKVEYLGGHPLLTDALNLLLQARDKVADWLELVVPVRGTETADGLRFERMSDGSVRISKAADPDGITYPNPLVEVTVDAGVWSSIVLCMSHFSERPGDWDKWMAHHAGTKDMLPDPNYRGPE